jgi:hypothetical protein
MPAEWSIVADGGEIIYVIALLVLAAGSAVFEKLKQKMADSKDRKPPDQRPSPPVRPTRQQPSRPAAPPPRPVQRSQPVRPARPAAPPRPVRPAAPTPHPQQPVARPMRPAPQRPPARQPERPVPAQPAPQAHRERPGRGEVGRVTQHRVESGVEKKAKAPRQAMGKLAADRRRDHPPAMLEPLETARSGSFRNIPLAEIRRAVVLNEILSAPIALRDPNWLDRY